MVRSIRTEALPPVQSRMLRSVDRLSSRAGSSIRHNMIFPFSAAATTTSWWPISSLRPVKISRTSNPPSPHSHTRWVANVSGVFLASIEREPDTQSVEGGYTGPAWHPGVASRGGSPPEPPRSQPRFSGPSGRQWFQFLPAECSETTPRGIKQQEKPASTIHDRHLKSNLMADFPFG